MNVIMMCASKSLRSCCVENSANDRDTIALEAIMLPKEEKEKFLGLVAVAVCVGVPAFSAGGESAGSCIPSACFPKLGWWLPSHNFASLSPSPSLAGWSRWLPSWHGWLDLMRLTLFRVRAIHSLPPCSIRKTRWTDDDVLTSHRMTSLLWRPQ